jgi:hypothetical protein
VYLNLQPEIRAPNPIVLSKGGSPWVSIPNFFAFCGPLLAQVIFFRARGIASDAEAI